MKRWKPDLADVLCMWGFICITIGLAFFDWRVALIVVGLLLFFVGAYAAQKS